MGNHTNIKTLKKIHIEIFAFIILSLLLLPLFSDAAEVPVYRFYSTKYKSHLYTASEKEKANIIANWPSDIWEYQTIEFPAYNSPDTGLAPVHRFWSKKYRTLYYTTSDKVKDDIIKNWPTYIWEYQGIKFYISETQQDGLTPVHKFWSTKYKSSYFTTSPGQKDCMIESYSDNIWRYDGIVWWVPEDGANLKSEVSFCGGNFGPNISVGLHAYTRDSLKDTSFRLTANKKYLIKDKNGDIIDKINPDNQTKVKYDSDGNLRIYDSIPEVLKNREITFEAADGNNSSIIFNLYIAGNSIFDNYDEYRGKIKLKYIDNSSSSYYKRIWVINDLPLEHYTWGMGEITGTGPMEYNKLMTTVYRTYGYWKILYSTKYAKEGFKVDATPGNQIYRGYDWEKLYPRVKEGALATRGRLIKYKNEYALTPYSSWTDGRTRSFEERWGSTLYPWCKSVSDPYGDYNGDYWNNPYKSTADLVASGNHMVGISAHGALSLANDEGWDWYKILTYYLNGVGIERKY